MSIRLIVLYFALIFNVSASNRFIISDYEGVGENVLARQPDSPREIAMEPEVATIITHLNVDPASEIHLHLYLTTVDSVEKILQVYKTGVYFLSAPQSFEEQGVETIKEGKHWVDSRALHLLNFVYLTKPNIDPWLRYHYALALVYFPELATNKFEKINPMTFAFKIYDQWLQTLINDQIAEDMQIEEYQSIQMTTFAGNSQREKYDHAHLAFYALLSLKMSSALRARDNMKPDRFEKQLMHGLRKYEPIRRMEADESNSEATVSWLEGPAYIALGAAAVPALILAHRVAKSLDH